MLALALVGTAATACGVDVGSTPQPLLTPECTPGPTEPVTLEGREAIFDLDDIAVVSGAVTENGYIVIDARSTDPIQDLAIEFVQVVTDAGFDVAGTDNEGVEAEVFFQRGDIAAGVVRMTESTCAGYVDIEISVLDDPAVLPRA